jgi:hypothetical protein
MSHVTRRFQLLVSIIFAFGATAKVRADGFLIGELTRRDMVFDSTGNHLYISSSSGTVRTFNLATRTFGATYNLGGSLNGLDISRDNSFLLIAQSNTTSNQGTFHKVNLASGAVTDIHYTLAFYETGGWDVAIASNGVALVTTEFAGSGWTPLRQINLATNAISMRTDAPGSGGGGQVRQDTQIQRSSDGTRLLFMESNISSGPAFTYSAIANSFASGIDTNAFLDYASGAVSRNGGLLALRTYGSPASVYTAPDFILLHTFTGLDSGVAFDGSRDIMYGVNSTTDEIIAYSTTTYAELFRLKIDEDVQAGSTMFGTGTLVASPDGRWLALETDSGIRVIALPAPPSQPYDFNRDQKPDYLLFNASTRQTSIWYLNNNVYLSSALGPTLPAGWRLVDIGDFNRDGKPDYVLFNASTRRTTIWYLNNNAYLSGAFGPTVPAGSSLVAVGDFNRDGKPDYVLFNASTRQTAIWYLNNNVYISAANGPTLPANWQIVGVADFNRDGKPDYLLFNSSTRQTAIWYLNNNAFVSSVAGPTVSAGYSLTGTADFNRDYKPDYVLFNAGTHRTAIWYLNNNAYVSGAYGPTLPAGWTLVKP